MKMEQRALSFFCKGSSLVGIIDVPERPLQRGLLVLADAPQYRVGGHRQFTLLSRALAVRGIPVMRFDRRGMGDSEGEPRASDTVDEDVRSALKEFFAHMPEMKEVVILGLGDGATAAALYAPQDERVRGLVLLNPQMRKTHGSVHHSLGHHYLARLGEVAFWKKIAAGKVDLAASAAALRQNVREHRQTLPRRLIASLAGFSGQVLVVLGGADPAAQEATRLLARHHVRCRRVEIPEADHAFASRAWREQVAATSANWIVSW
ncbi:hydrolase 1, exosortase A system-associated [Massilia horti]|uniref:Hydrolase 1, exosortase A system-associated n=1 Tax=Massilia horti TaxID=2562153 RepID=A0A4Y9TA16_9BURK|nr:hydrolase 1, exosortase A system-associated [Massilia horti]TFW35381.1 hydrolase 1, exosortase A system-associated [Massilia horti]